MSQLRVVLEGVMVLFVGNGRPYCYVGIVKNVPEHTAQLIVNEISGGEPEEKARIEHAQFQPRLWLQAAKATTKIELITDGTGRLNRNGPDSDDFRWVLNFEGPEVYDHRIAVDQSGFSAILRINDGKFYTKEVSDNKLRLFNRTQDRPIGKVATKVRILINLASGESAALWNGAGAVNPVFEFAYKSGVDYGVYLKNVRPHAHPETSALMEQIDAEFYYNALGGDVVPSDKFHFDIPHRVDPDARCLIGWMGQTDLS